MSITTGLNLELSDEGSIRAMKHPKPKNLQDLYKFTKHVHMRVVEVIRELCLQYLT